MELRLLRTPSTEDHRASKATLASDPQRTPQRWWALLAVDAGGRGERAGKIKDSQGFGPQEKASNSSNLSLTPTLFKGSYRIFNHVLIHVKVPIIYKK